MQDKKNSTDLVLKKSEKALSHIGAQIADANEIAEEIEELTHKAEEKLCLAQEEISELYVELGEEASLQKQNEKRKPG